MPSSELRAFVVRVVAVFALVACAWMIWTLSDLLLMVFGAIVVAVLLRALSSWVTRRRRVSDSWVLALVVTVLTVGFTALLWLFGSQLASEVGALQRASLQAWTRVHDWLAAGPLGPALEELTRQAPARVSNLAPRAGAFAPSITGGMANLFLVLAGAGYLAAQPRPYRRGVLLLPARVRATPTMHCRPAAPRCGCGYAACDARDGGDWRSVVEAVNDAQLPNAAGQSPIMEDLYDGDGVDFRDPLVSPAFSDAVSDAVRRQVPPTLSITATRATQLSAAAYTQSRLIDPGREWDLHVWGGLGHAFHHRHVAGKASGRCA